VKLFLHHQTFELVESWLKLGSSGMNTAPVLVQQFIFCPRTKLSDSFSVVRCEILQQFTSFSVTSLRIG
jgi:hypothetical protein